MGLTATFIHIRKEWIKSSQISSELITVDGTVKHMFVDSEIIFPMTFNDVYQMIRQERLIIKCKNLSNFPTAKL
jgi:hypothetical protein